MRERLAQQLQQQADAGLWREHQLRQSAQGEHVVYNNKSLLNFNNNDYLGLSNDSQVKKAFVLAAEKYGVGSGSANTLSGYTQAHESLVETLKTWLKRDKVLLFSSGYIANLAILTSLVQSQDIIFSDKLNHASLNDGMRFSGAKFKRFAHNDLQKLEQYMAKSDNPNKWIVTEGVFSMEGDAADLPHLNTLAKQYKAQLVVDDVHGLGVLGETGAGSLELHRLSQEDVPIIMGGFGKAFGTQGAFVAGSAEFIDTLMQFARPYLFTTALAPALAAATQKSIEIIQQDKARRAHLQDIIEYFRESARKKALQLLPSKTAIQPIVFDSITVVMGLSQALAEEGIMVSCIRYPTVPMDQPRLRVSLSAMHSKTDIDRLLTTLEKILHVKNSSLTTNHS